MEDNEYMAEVKTSCGSVGISSNSSCGDVRNHRQCVEEITEKASSAVRKSCVNIDAEKCPPLMQAALGKYNVIEHYQSCLRNQEIAACHFKGNGTQAKLDQADVRDAQHEVQSDRNDVVQSADQLVDSKLQAFIKAQQTFAELQSKKPAASAAELAAAKSARDAASREWTEATNAQKLAHAIVKDNKSTAKETASLKAELAKISGGSAILKQVQELNKDRKQLAEEQREAKNPNADRKSLHDLRVKAEVEKEKAEGNREIKAAQDKLRDAKTKYNGQIDAAAKAFEDAKHALEAGKKNKASASEMAQLEANKNAAMAALREITDKRDEAVLHAQHRVIQEEREKFYEVRRTEHGKFDDNSAAAKKARADVRDEWLAVQKKYRDSVQDERNPWVKERTDVSVVQARLNELRDDPKANPKEIQALEDNLRVQQQEADAAKKKFIAETADERKAREEALSKLRQKRDKEIADAHAKEKALHDKTK